MRHEDHEQRVKAAADFRRHVAAFAATAPGDKLAQMGHKYQAAMAVARTGFARGFKPHQVRGALADFCYCARRGLDFLEAHEVFLRAVTASKAEWNASQ